MDDRKQEWTYYVFGLGSFLIVGASVLFGIYYLITHISEIVMGILGWIIILLVGAAIVFVIALVLKLFSRDK